MKTVWKYDPVLLGHLSTETNRFTLRLPVGAHFLHAAPQTPEATYPMIWMEIDNEVETTERTFALVPTGGEIPASEPTSSPDTEADLWQWDHLATAVCLEGRLVWHVYIEPDDGIPF